MNNSDALLEIDGVWKTYAPPPQSDDADWILRGVDLVVRDGDRIAVRGPSGCGKSTLLNIMGALDRPTRGEARYRGKALPYADDRELASFRNRRVGFIFQLHHLLPQCSVLENALMPCLPLGDEADPEAAEKRALRLLDRVGLKKLAHQPPARLSGGERQRAAVVRALINRPELLLADEPTGALDRSAAESLSELLLELNREEGVALIVVTHAADLASRMDRQYRLEDGALVL